MKGRALFVIVAIAVIGLVAYLARNTYWDEVTVPTPLRGEAEKNPFYASQKLAEALGASAEWRPTLGELPADAVLVLSNWYWDSIDDRRARIERWVESGGHLVVDGWLIINQARFAEWSGVARTYRTNEDSEDDDGVPQETVTAFETSVREIVGDQLCGMLTAVAEDGTARPDGRSLDVCTLDDFRILETDRPVRWGYANENGLQAVRVDVGRGSVTVLNMRPFANRYLTERDNAKLFVEATNLRRGSRLIFVSEHEHPSLLQLIWLYGAPVVVLAALAVAAFLWRGSVRFGPLAAAPDQARRSLAEQIRGTGQFTLRLGGGSALHAATVRALHELASRRIARYAGLSHEQRIEAIASATGIADRELRAALAPNTPRRKSELAQTLALLERARRSLAGIGRTHSS